MDSVLAHIDKRLEPFKKDLWREVTRDDLLRLMEIKMKRILRFNSDEADRLIANYRERVADIDLKLANIIQHTIDWYLHLKEKYGDAYPRHTVLRSFDSIEAATVAEANERLYINREEGFIGTSPKKDEYVCQCSDIDDIIIFYKDGKYKVVKVQDKNVCRQRRTVCQRIQAQRPAHYLQCNIPERQRRHILHEALRRDRSFPRQGVQSHTGSSRLEGGMVLGQSQRRGRGSEGDTQAKAAA